MNELNFKLDYDKENNKVLQTAVFSEENGESIMKIMDFTDNENGLVKKKYNFGNLNKAIYVTNDTYITSTIYVESGTTRYGIQSGKYRAFSLKEIKTIYGSGDVSRISIKIESTEAIEDITNAVPKISDNTTPNKTLYEGSVLTLTGNILDENNGDVVSVKYSINNGTTRAIASGISDGVNPIPYNKSLIFKEGKLYDGATAVSNQLSDNAKHLIKLWGEDDKGGKSEEKEIFFYVVNNRPAKLTINPISAQNDLIDTDAVLIKGNVNDPDANETTINYKINSGSFIKLNTGMDRDFEIRIPISNLNDGNNNVTIQAKDSYGAITEKVVKLNKEKNVQPLKTAVREYKMIPPDGAAKGILLWIQREVGDLTTKVEIKFGNKSYQELPVSHTGLVTTGIEEDEYVYENSTEESEIYLRITMNRTSTSSNKGIKLISGVFN
ncbi:hypothetical protein [Tissierella praeacuta]|uniref:hypothetical protein n=1 Tax=Tissierella praeacuta TaxID=43131 RepID=UPI00333E663A